jgi:hypothetical protein
VSSSTTGLPSSSHCFKVRASMRGEVYCAGSIPSTPKAMISFLILTSIRLNG